MHVNDSSTTINPGGTVQGSALNYCCINADPADTGNEYQGSGTHPAGTWRVGGFIQNSNSAAKSITVCTRIDGTQLAAPHMMRSAGEGGQVRNCHYAAADNSVIDCEIEVYGIWIPFSATANDCTVYGPLIYQNAAAGKYGDVAEYSAG